MTTSGYPRIIKEWKRGTPLSSAQTLIEGKDTDVSVSGHLVHDHGRIYEFLSRGVTFFSDETSVRRGDEWGEDDKPADAMVSTYCDNIILQLRSDWKVGGTTYKGGSLLAENFDAYMKGERKFSTLFEPTDRKSLESMTDTKNFLILTELDFVHSRPYMLRFENGQMEPDCDGRSGVWFYYC